MRQLKNIKKGHFVKYGETLCQVNCFANGCATLVEVKEAHESKRLFSVPVAEKVEYIGEIAVDGRGYWVGYSSRINPFLTIQR